MGLSRLEKYMIILDALILEPVELEGLAFSTNIECRRLKQYLNFLISHQLVERQVARSKVQYVISDRGLTVAKLMRAQKYFDKLKHVLPLPEQAKKAESLTAKANRSNKK